METTQECLLTMVTCVDKGLKEYHKRLKERSRTNRLSKFSLLPKHLTSHNLT